MSGRNSPPCPYPEENQAEIPLLRAVRPGVIDGSSDSDSDSSDKTWNVSDSDSSDETRNGGTPSGQNGDGDGAVAGPSSAAPGPGRSRKRKDPRKIQRKTISPKKKSPPKKRTSPKKKIVRRYVDVPDADNYLAAINNDCINKITLHFKNDGTQATKQIAYEIGSIDVIALGGQFISCFPEVNILNQSQLIEAFTGVIGETLVSVTLHVSVIPTRSVIAVRRERKVLTQENIRADQEIIEDSTIYFYVDMNGFDPQLCKGFRDRSATIFRLDIAQFEKKGRILTLNVGVFHNSIYNNQDTIPPITEASKPTLKILKHFLTGEDGNLEEADVGAVNRSEDLLWFYGQLKKYHASEQLPIDLDDTQTQFLVPELRHYQKKAVAWMATREGYAGSEESNKPDLVKYILDPLFIPVDLGEDRLYDSHPDYPTGGVAYLNTQAGYLAWEVPKIPPMPSGGILADEMGLGKTVEVLSLILLNPRYGDDSDSDTSVSNESSDNKSPNSRKKRASKSGKESKTADRRLLHPFLRRKRKVSPSEFKTKEFSGESDSADEPTSPTKTKSRENKRKINGGKTTRKVESESEFSESDEAPTPTAGPSSSSGLRLKRMRVQISSDSSEAEDMAPELPLDNFSDKIEVSKSLKSQDDDSSSELLDLDSRPCTPTLQAKDSSEEELLSLNSEPVTPRAVKEEGSDSLLSLDSEPMTPAPPPRVTRNSVRKSTTQSAPAETTYSKVKVMYDTALAEYSSAKKAKVTTRFKGQFFNPFVGSKSFFECVCGEDEGELEENVVVCTQCGSSQHADCVRYDVTINGGLDRESYLCPHCIALTEPLSSKTTLIISPMTISHQWISEVKRHVQGKMLQILLYKGVSKHGYIPPRHLAKYDIIISTYTVLSAELDHADLPHSNSADGRRLRNAKRFLTIPSPLPSVEYWRVCLDEAQMVESSLTRMANMARRLKAVHRWCVTGTPINKGLEDLRGLIAFLGVHPLEDESWWGRLVSEPFYRKDFTFLNELFGQLIWRTGKQDVLDQLGVPPQSEILHVLKFSALERHFYKRQLDVCGKNTLAKIARIGLSSLDVKLSSLNRQTLNILLDPLLQLRQACVHPQMVRGESFILAKSGRNLTMEELLDQLIRKVLIQCADEQRKIVSSLNGMASIHCIMENYVEASKKYREVLQLAATHEDKFMTDTLQMLHALENLADILDMNVPGVGFTLRDDSLRDRAKDLRQKYLAKHEAGVMKAREAGSEATREVREQIEKCVSNRNKKSSWFTDIIRRAHTDNKQESLIVTIKEELKTYASKRKDTSSLANLFEHGAGLERVLIGKITEMESMRDSVLLSLEDLESREPSSYVNAAVACHLRGQLPQKGKNLCSLCTYHEQFLAYESMLFREQTLKKVARTGRNRQKLILGSLILDDAELAASVQKEQEEEELLQTTEHVNFLGHRKGEHWGDSDMEKSLKIILNFGKLNRVGAATIESGKNHMKVLESAKKEFRSLRELWTEIFDQVSAFDEIAQATTRLRLRTAHDVDEPGPSSSMVSKQAQKELRTDDGQLLKLQNIHLLEPHELDYKLQQMMDEYTDSFSKIAVHLGQHMFLLSLKRNGYGRNGNFNAEECSICSNPLGHEWCVLICGHSYCSDCVRKMCKDGAQSFSCPICRISTNMKQVSFVDTKAASKDEKEKDGPGPSSPKIPKEIKGSHSTKVEAIIETLLELQDTHPGEKVLIFSTWADMLTIIGHAMEENYIKHSFLSKSSGSSGANSFEAVIDRFKKREEIQVLLMLVSSGSKGLNLVEATHVFLVEPILNLASELQAIGRVHRIGQTKNTYVHRFYVRDTIEEQLYNMLKKQDISVDEEASMTVAELRNLFLN